MADPIRPLPAGLTGDPGITREELQLATRNHGMPLEALRWPVTPTGMHYLLIHYDVPMVEPATWRLEIGGAVRRPRMLTLDEVRARPSVTRPVTLECAGNGRARLSPRALSQPWLLEAVGTSEWTGTPLWPLLEEAGVSDDAVDVVFTALDEGVEGGVEQRYARALPLGEARRDEVLLVWGMNGAELPPQHGFPLRLLVPGWYGMASVKWLSVISVATTPYRGYQQERAYRWRSSPDEDGEPVTRIVPRSLVVPPGIPEFLSRRRFLPLGACELRGRAWSGTGPIVRVEVSADGGRTWADAEVEPAAAEFAWHGWRHRWEPPGPGDYTLCCRATDAAGRRQPTEPRWNLGGYADNDVQRIEVTVTA